MPVVVRLTHSAARDLEELCHYLDQHGSPGDADQVLTRIEKAFADLAEFPLLGRRPAELSGIGIRHYREVSVRPYRVIYQVVGDGVYVMVIADGRRDMQALLLRRLLDA